MNEQIVVAIIGLVGVLVGGAITSIPIFMQLRREQQRWLVDKKIAYLQDQISEIENTKKPILKDLQNVLKGENFDNNDNFVSSVPMEVIHVFGKHLSTGTTFFRDLTEAKKREIFADVATALEKKKLELKEEIKKLVS